MWTYSHQGQSHLSASAIGFGPNSVYLTGNSPSFITRLNRHNGSLEWERLKFLERNNSVMVSVTGVIADQKDNPLVLYNRQRIWWEWNDDQGKIVYQQKLPYQQPSQKNELVAQQASGSGATNDFVIKLNGATADHEWEVNCLTDLNKGLDFLVFSVISLASDSSFVVKAQYYNAGDSTYLMNTMSCETGELSSTTHLKSPFELKSPTKATYKGDEYNLRSVYHHVYGKTRLYSGFVINKNTCPDGYYLTPSTSTTSRATYCPGFSWSLSDPHGDQLTCPYSYGRCGPVGIFIIFFIPLVLVVGFSYRLKISTVHILSSLLSYLVFSIDLTYLTGVVFKNVTLFGLALMFILLPSLHLVQYLFNAHHGQRRRIRLLFRPPGALNPLTVLSSRDGGVPYFRESRCLPSSVQPSEDIMLLVGGWMAAGFAQALYAILWVVFHTIPLLPWLLVHGPWYAILFLAGYLLYRLGLLQHREVKDHWLLLLFHPEETLENPTTSETTTSPLPDRGDLESCDGEDLRPTMKTADASGEIILTSIYVFFLGLIGGIIVQTINNKKMHYHGLLPVLCVIFKALFFLNILNRIAVVYGSEMLPHLRSTIFLLFPSYVTQAPFAELQSDERAEQQGENSEELLVRIHELESEVQFLRARLSQYEPGEEREANRNGVSGFVIEDEGDDEHKGDEELLKVQENQQRQQQEDACQEPEGDDQDEQEEETSHQRVPGAEEEEDPDVQSRDEEGGSSGEVEEEERRETEVMEDIELHVDDTGAAPEGASSG
jgi:hypothetical protein